MTDGDTPNVKYKNMIHSELNRNACNVKGRAKIPTRRSKFNSDFREIQFMRISVCPLKPLQSTTVQTPNHGKKKGEGHLRQLYSRWSTVFKQYDWNIFYTIYATHGHWPMFKETSFTTMLRGPFLCVCVAMAVFSPGSPHKCLSVSARYIIYTMTMIR